MWTDKSKNSRTKREKEKHCSDKGKQKDYRGIMKE